MPSELEELLPELPDHHRTQLTEPVELLELWSRIRTVESVPSYLVGRDRFSYADTPFFKHRNSCPFHRFAAVQFSS